MHEKSNLSLVLLYVPQEEHNERFNADLSTDSYHAAAHIYYSLR